MAVSARLRGEGRGHLPPIGEVSIVALLALPAVRPVLLLVAVGSRRLHLLQDAADDDDADDDDDDVPEGRRRDMRRGPWRPCRSSWASCRAPASSRTPRAPLPEQVNSIEAWNLFVIAYF